MADLKPWLERELTSQLRPVAAPDGLWESLMAGGAPAARRTERRPLSLGLWPAFAAAVLLAAAALYVQARTQLRDISRISERELRILADDSSGISIRSDDGSRIRNWVKAKGDIEIELPPNPAGAVHLLGAKLVELRGTLIAAVAYHVGGDSATLLVSRKRSAFWNSDRPSKHLFTRVQAPDGSSLVSWGMRDQNYAIAYAGFGDARSGCLLCHAESHGRL